jgi:hypothetical protein
MTIVTGNNNNNSNNIMPWPPNSKHLYIPRYRSGIPTTASLNWSLDLQKTFGCSSPKASQLPGRVVLLNCHGPETSPFGIRFFGIACDKHHIGWFT